MAIEVNHEKWEQVRQLNQGDIIELTDGDECEFVRLKQKKFIGIMNGKTYDIPVNMFVKVIKKAESIEDKLANLEEGELFYIQGNSGRAYLYKFLRLKGNKIIGINPISKTKTTIDRDMYVGKVKNID